jgi:dTDP-4-amino-4,6-dideoxygalactose transaminase
MKIPFVDLNAQYITLKQEINAAIDRVVHNGSFIGGNEVLDFENSFGKWLGIQHVIGCANGTDSLEILLKSYNIGKGDEVIVPAISWISTSEAVSNVGATPVFVDIHPNFFTIDVDQIEYKISSKTKAIIPVHLYGQACNMEEIMRIAYSNQLIVIEDCAQAHGALWKDKLVGTIGHAASFSFYPGKNLGAYGDAGAMVTNDNRIAEMARMIANHGQKGKHNHIIEGRNSRLDGIQAAILNVKLNYLKDWNDKRRSIALEYNKRLNPDFVEIPVTNLLCSHVYHLYVIKTSRRSELQIFLKENNIQTAIHYPKALPFLACYEGLNYTDRDFPVASIIQNQILSLPIYAEMNIEQINFICSEINTFFDAKN